MSIEEVSSGEVAGFCQVAWLPSPSCIVDEIGLQRNNDEAQIIFVSNDSPNVPRTCFEERNHSYCDEVSKHSYHQCDEVSIQCAPAIIILVKSPCRRRTGKASRVLKFASKSTRTHWCCDNTSTRLGLYVHPKIKSTLRLYSMKGLSVISYDGEDDLLCMIQRRWR